MRQPVSVHVYPVRRNHGRWEYLLLRRVPMPKLGLESFWQGVTGGLEDAETPRQAAVRELCEETGFVDARLEDLGYSYSFPIQKEWRHLYASDATEIVEHAFVACVDPSQAPKLSWEHDEYRWCSFPEAMGLLRYPGNRTGLERCDEHLRMRE